MSQVRIQNGPAIRAIRERSGLRVRDVASEVGVHEDTLRNIETEAKGASEVIVARLARALSVPVTAIRKQDVA